MGKGWGEERASGKLRAVNDESRITAGGALDHVDGPWITTSRDNYIDKRQREYAVWRGSHPAVR